MGAFEGKKMLISGASRGLGEVCARHFAAQGATLVLMARTAEKLESVRVSCADPQRHLALAVDLCDAGAAQAAAERALSFCGQLDVVLHTAGGGLGLKHELLSAEDLGRLFALNVGAAVALNRVVAPQMRQRQQGNLVHVGSIASAEAVGSVGYNTVKAALAAYVRSLGRELARDQVVVTGILPGGFYAPGNAMQRLQQNAPEAYQKFVEERLPRKKMGQAEELLPLLSLLCSEQASMLSGCMLPIDAGEGRAYTSG